MEEFVKVIIIKAFVLSFLISRVRKHFVNALFNMIQRDEVPLPLAGLLLLHGLLVRFLLFAFPVRLFCEPVEHFCHGSVGKVVASVGVLMRLHDDGLDLSRHVGCEEERLARLAEPEVGRK